jgi:hypothetical protein
MRRTRASYHYTIRLVKRNEQHLIRQRFAQAVLNGNNRDLWSEIRRLNSTRSVPPRTIDGQTSSENIAHIFAEKYNHLYNSVSYNARDMEDVRSSINERVALAGYTDDYFISKDDVASAICKLKPNKNDGDRGLSTSHFIHGSDGLTGHTANLFSGLLIHGSVIDDFLTSTIIPIPKGNNTNVTDSENYRGIALSSVLGRIFDLIVLNRYSDSLVSCDLQFGFKKNRSTAMCTMIVKEAISLYTSSNSTVHCVFLDSSKAFDRVEYCKLFKLLMDRHVPAHVTRILLNMYTGQQVRVLWNGATSGNFPISNGVKQGAIVSPILFCVYLDTLLIELKKAGVGCYIGNWFVAALGYADDVVLLAPTARAMRTMLGVCDKFASEFNVLFNANKSKCITFKKQSYLVTQAPPRHSASSLFSISGNCIENVYSWSHLGHILRANLLDDDDILSRRNSLVGQINSFLCNFSKVDVLVKNALFRVYCSSHYGSELWDLTNPKVEDYCVAWRKGLRKLWKLPYDCRSVNVAVVSNTVPLYDELCRRVLNFVRTCLHCDSPLVQAIVTNGVSAGMNSPIGRNVAHCSAYFNLSVGNIGASKLRSCDCSNMFNSKIDTQSAIQANVLREILLIRDGLLEFSSDLMEVSELDDFIMLLAN